MSAEDVQTLYDRMMENARRAENKFILAAAKKQPNPSLKAAEPMAKEVQKESNSRERVDVEKDVNEVTAVTSSKIEISQPQTKMVKEP
jgi:hypothetical protein